MITVPPATAIRAQIISDIEGKIGQTIPAAPKAFFRVLATALAGVLVLLYRFGDWAYGQIFPQTADAEGLALIGEQYGLIRAAAVAAVFEAKATGDDDTIIPAGTLWTAGGIVYSQQAAVTISGGVATITVEALTAGDDTNQAASSIISLVTPMAGVETDATVGTTTITGEDAENLETYRARILSRLRNRPQGGATPDFIGWAIEVPGIVKAFAFRTAPGEVTVYPLIALSGSRIPGAPKLAEVQAYLQDTTRRPLCANVYAAAMTELELVPTVASISPDTTAMRTAVEDAWSAYLFRAYPAQYSDEANPTNVVSLAALYAEAIGAGVNSISLTMELTGGTGPIESYTLHDDEIIALGTVSWPT